MKRLTCLILGALLIWMLVSCGTLPPAEPTATSIPASPSPGPSSVPSESQQRPETEWHLVVIGDSSLGGLGEGVCIPDRKRCWRAGRSPRSCALAGLSAGTCPGSATGGSATLVLAWREELADDLRQAEVVVMFVNPVDSVDPEQTAWISMAVSSIARRLPAVQRPLSSTPPT